MSIETTDCLMKPPLQKSF